MKKIAKKTLAVLLTLALLSGMFVCFAAEKKYHDYSSYVLLGDSVASGWSDVVDRETRFVRVEESYGAHVADDLGVDVYHPMACIGFRTVEMRYIFEDDFEGDRFLFYSIDDEEMERRIPEIRKAVSEADLITLGIGGNDWGSFLGWHVYEEMDKIEETNEEFLTEAKAYLENAGTDENTIDSIVDIATLCGALPQLVTVLPKALQTGLDNFFTNWNYMIEDIYALNPDVTLLVVGMVDNSVQSEEDVAANESAALKLSISKAIVDFANKPMIEGAEKYGYTFVDTTGTVCEKYHPSDAGHRFIADKILEALPDANFPYTDVQVGSDEYKAVEYMYKNDIMAGLTDTEFGADKNVTASQLADAFAKINVADIINTTDPDSEISRLDFAKAIINAASAEGFNLIKFVKTFTLAINTIFGGGITNINSNLTRGQTAVLLMRYIEL